MLRVTVLVARLGDALPASGPSGDGCQRDRGLARVATALSVGAAIMAVQTFSGYADDCLMAKSSSRPLTR